MNVKIIFAYCRLKESARIYNTINKVFILQGLRNTSLFINHESLIGGEWYLLQIAANTPGSPNGTANITFLMNKPPQHGKCSVNPKEGRRLH